MTFSSTVNKKTKTLQMYYQTSLIPYPRLCNDFERESTFELFPHPPMPIMRGINEPLKNKELKINKQNSLIYLSLLKIIKPSDTVKISSIIDEYFDDDLEFKNENKIENFNLAKKTLSDLLIQEDLKEKDLFQFCNSFYSKKNKDTISNSLSVYNIQDCYFRPESNVSTKKNNKKRFIHYKLVNESNTERDEAIKKSLSFFNDEDNFIKYDFKNINDAIDSFIEKRKISLEKEINPEIMKENKQ